jgi:replication factor C large subunit
MDDWTEKYRPKILEEIIGNERAIANLRSWAEQWHTRKPSKKRAVILSGKPGVGKTSSALALANEYKWTVLELNASDARNAPTIRRIATSGAVNETFDAFGQFTPSKSGGRKLIILDEADNLYERVEKSTSYGDFNDRGGKKAIIETIKVTKQPIVLIVNDYYSLVKGGGESLRQISTMISFYEVSSFHIVELLKRICREERVSADVKVLQTIADRSKGDVRSAINDLQSLCVDRQQVDLESIDVLGYRDREKIIFDALRELFKTTTIAGLRESMRSVDIPPEMFLIWVNENLPREYIDVDDLVKGFEALSKADVFFGRVYRRQQYGLWSYACDLMHNGVSASKSHNYGNMKYYAPSWLKRLRESKSLRGVRDSLLLKLGRMCHTSRGKTNSYLPVFRQLFRDNLRFAVNMKNRLELTEGEMKFLLGEKYEQKLREIQQYLERSDEKQVEIPESLPEKKSKNEKDESLEVHQPSILDF